MNRIHLVILFLFLWALKANAQISFEKGYYIDSANLRVECFIRNVDWNRGPRNFEYRIGDGAIQTRKTNSVTEFGIDGISRFVWKKVRIDRSGDPTNTDSLSFSRSPFWSDERLLLHVLVEGRANLYEYQEETLARYFYEADGSAIKQLVYKKYRLLNDPDRIAINSDFRQQLATDLKSPAISINELRRISLAPGELKSLFRKYNTSDGEKPVVERKERSKFHFRVKLGVDFTSLAIIEPTFFGGEEEFALGNHANVHIGVEGEYILPFNKNKWAVVLEPSFQRVSASGKGSYHGRATVNFSSIETPVGLRYYFYLKNQNRIFVNVLASYYDWPVSSLDNSITFADGYTVGVMGNPKFGFGAGFATSWLSLEVRGWTSNDFANGVGWATDYRKVSVVAGFRIF